MTKRVEIPFTCGHQETSVESNHLGHSHSLICIRMTETIDYRSADRKEFGEFRGEEVGELRGDALI